MCDFLMSILKNSKFHLIWRRFYVMIFCLHFYWTIKFFIYVCSLSFTASILHNIESDTLCCIVINASDYLDSLFGVAKPQRYVNHLLILWVIFIEISLFYQYKQNRKKFYNFFFSSVTVEAKIVSLLSMTQFNLTFIVLLFCIKNDE